ncbi:helix-turn-helix transcriptional regulator [Acinetobacter sp. B5B]|uniref:winged helix-turn-helix transcriptional regulator n=1 Tax=Acinetobacter baretiae TaxID=2605383 RepID=UPI0018C2F580|nr:helix-turn-helix domain-containing protein [Acinetobacter baretiae]MBF7681781.1 helix-turn-helix transcriptional regulator [Acinetobacter baretiae]MBF7685390.1 helix-turn-helix transcriptional regulator [Acinetobacter baretiae]
MDTVKQPRYESYQDEACPVEATLELIGGKGKGIILYHLLDGKLRFNEVRRKLGPVTARILTKQLRELEHSNLIYRIVYPQVPPKVEYGLTEYGETLRPLISMLKLWGEQYGIKLLQNQNLNTTD